MKFKPKTNDTFSFLLIIAGIALWALLIVGYMVDCSQNANRGARNSNMESPTDPPATFQAPASKEPVRITVPTPSTGLIVAKNLYAKSGEVFAIDRGEDTVYFFDKDGQEWSFFGAEDWFVGDRLCAIFDSLGTFTRSDDVIINITYEAWDY